MAINFRANLRQAIREWLEDVKQPTSDLQRAWRLIGRASVLLAEAENQIALDEEAEARR